MRVDLDCPYKDHTIARRLGARWDAARKTWYIEDVPNVRPFLRWIKNPTLLAPSPLGKAPPPFKRPAPEFARSGKKSKQRKANSSNATALRQIAMLDAANHAHIASLLH